MLLAGGCVAVQLVSAAPASAATSSATTIATGYTHTCVIRSGAAYCWGDNTYGELGNNSTMSSDVPVAVNTGGVLAGVTLAQISASYQMTCALSTAGAAYCWGSDATGQLGNNSTTQSNVPVAVSTSGVLAGVTLTQISAGGSTGFACAVSSAGAAYCWGANAYGQLGNTSTTQSLVPVAVSKAGVLAGVTLTQITSGDASACALATTGAAYCWGTDANGQLGNNSTTSSDVPVAVSGGLTFSEIDSGANHACALTTAGAARCWGYNANGQLGNNSTTQSLVPVAVTATGVLSGVTLAQISTGYQVSCALSAAGAAYCWGQSALGNGTTGQSLVPVTVTATGVLAGVTLTQISAGGSYNGRAVCALSTAGAAYCWGYNATGQVGNPAMGVTFSVPVAVTAAPTLIATGASHACLLRNGKAWCWGDNTYGELGINSLSPAQSTTPVAVYTGGALSGVTLTQITAGSNFTCALSSAGAAYCWGQNSTGDLGNNTTTNSDFPVTVTVGSPSAISSTTVVTQLAVNDNGAFVCALSAAGAVYCWGHNSDGELGNNTTTNSSVAVAVTTSGVLSGVTVTGISAGGNHACAQGSAGVAYCWGDGSAGSLGNNTTTNSSVPVAVTTTGTSLAGVILTQVASGLCALGTAGLASCWGPNTVGQLGNGTYTEANVATAVTTSGALSGVSLAQVSGAPTTRAPWTPRGWRTAGATTLTASWATRPPPPAAAPGRATTSRSRSPPAAAPRCPG